VDDNIRRCAADFPCPICKSTRWCQVINGSVAQCMHVGDGAYQQITQADGATAYLHRLAGATTNASPDVASLRPPETRADPDLIHQAYEKILAAMHLGWTSSRREALRARGLSDDWINRARYSDYPAGKPRWDLARRLIRKFGTAALGVPGLVVRTGPKGPYLTLAGPPGLLIPVRSWDGRIAALKIRRDEPGPGGSRYVYLTSASKNWAGPKAADVLHVPLGTDLGGPVLRITEGPLKADVCAARGDLPTVAIPSAGGWKRALDLLAGVPQVTEVRVALDADFRTNPVVARGVRDLLSAVVNTGRVARLEVWDPAKAKGIDDALAAGVPVTVLDPEESRRVAAEACATLDVADEPGGLGPGGPPGASAAAAGPNKAVDDPFELARGFLDRHHRHESCQTLRYHRDAWHAWDGAAYREVPATELRVRVAGFTEEVLDAHNAAALAAWAAAGGDDEPPRAKRVTRNLVGDELQALGAETLLPATVSAPAWVDGGVGPDPRECLFAANGTVHLPALVDQRATYLIPPDPRLFNTSALPFSFEPAAPRPVEWLRFLDQVWPNDPQSIALLQEWFGYCLTPDTRQQKILLVVGPGRSGKGTVARILTRLVGPANTAAPTLGSLAERFGLWPLVGKSLAVVGDAHLSGRADAAVITERLKSISGEDLQTVDRKNREPVEVRLGVRFLILTNEVPRLSDASGVIASRLLLLRTTESHLGREDLGLEDRLAAELPGILLWAIEGWRRLRDRGRFVQATAGAEVLRDMEELASPIKGFVRDRCGLGPHRTVAIPDLYRAWQFWCSENGFQHPGPANLFTRNLRSAFPALAPARPRTAGGRERHLVGIDLNPDRAANDSQS
jgi:putative DNA primase/helicase